MENSPKAPPGLQALFKECHRVYPDQKNPLQVSTILKYWLGGNDVLDYISLYDHKGDPAREIPPHWHYVAFGLSDLHGDGRVHIPEPTLDLEFRSGMGFELTFRLLKSSDPNQGPPTWPANLLQDLARYVFNSGNRFCVGDNIPWPKKSLDSSNSKISHMLIAEDAELRRTETPFGWVDFCQIVGVTSEELDRASRWNGKGVLNLLRNNVTTGGEFLITDMKRDKSVFELFPETLRELEEDLEREGSDLVGVNAEFIFKEFAGFSIKEEVETEEQSEDPTMSVSREFVAMKAEEYSPFSTSMSTSNSLSMSGPIDSKPMTGHTVSLSGLELTLAPYAAKFLVLAIKDRIRHGRHFTFKSQNLAVTFVAESVTGAMVNRRNPYVVIGYWMQLLIPDDLVPRMLTSFEGITENSDHLNLPTTFEFLDKGLKIIIDNIAKPRLTESKNSLP
ncbi:suppressor of fused homolog [Phlebotomus argentipes]|uniref:suppressor of fused homolog n=1 Tax=Phlebotomus argentipes TaxID=94469 RepID=UPI00289341A7|nr:suppressor of fused homolog [Phlebotomus argentipes]